jgi:hypothetical protein
METTTNSGQQGQTTWAESSAASAELEKDKKQAGKPPRSFREKMPCKLTDEELVVRGASLADALAETERLDGERKNVNDGYKAKIELAEGKARELAGVLRSKTETREIEMLEEYIFATNTVRVIRADTKEVVRERAMTKAERQEELPLPKTEAAEPKKEGDAPAKPKKKREKKS